MLTIRQDQIEHFDKIAEERFVDRLISYLRDKQSVWVENSPDKELRQRVEWGINRARWHGFTWESSIMKFVALLARTDVPPDELADLLFTEITTEQWEAAMERYDPAAWEFDD